MIDFSPRFGRERFVRPKSIRLRLPASSLVSRLFPRREYFRNSNVFRFNDVVLIERVKKTPSEIDRKNQICIYMYWHGIYVRACLNTVRDTLVGVVPVVVIIINDIIRSEYMFSNFIFGSSTLGEHSPNCVYNYRCLEGNKENN